LEKARRICCHPLALPMIRWPASCSGLTVPLTFESSGKAARLAEILEEIIPSGEKVVIFVMRKSVIAILQELIQERFAAAGVVTLSFSGDLSLAQRSLTERRFAEESSCQVLLLTVNAGGVGLNLTTASHVVHFDRCYNPAREAQATDRCHRIGQQRPVCVHRLVTAGTFEERLDEIMHSKSELSSLAVASADDWIADFTDEQLFELFTLHPHSCAESFDSRFRLLSSPLVVAPIMSAARLPPSSVSNHHVEIGHDLCTPKRQRVERDSNVQEQRDDAGGEEECCICMDSMATALLHPCGHRVLCQPCALRVQTCPVCRTTIIARVPS